MTFWKVLTTLLSTVLLFSLSHAVPPEPNSCDVQNACFVIDQSSSLNVTEYASLARFVVSIASRLYRMNTDIAFSAAAFATTAVQIVPPSSNLRQFKSFLSRGQVLPSRGSNLQVGMQGCVDQLAGTLGNNVIILLTDGRQRGGDVVPVAESARDMGTAIVTVGIGPKARNKFLRSLGTAPPFYLKTFFDKLGRDVRKVTRKVCDAVDLLLPSPTAEPSQPATFPSPSPIPCGVRYICFAMDQSGSINSTEYILEASFILGLAVDLERVNTLVSYGITAFATTAEAILPFPSDLAALEAVLTEPRALDGETNMQDGLQGCVDMLQSVSENRVILLVTDGRESTGSALPVADDAKAMGIGIATVGIGNKVDKKFLRELATDPSYFTRSDFHDLLRNVGQVTATICGATANQLPTPSPSASPTPSVTPTPIPCDVSNICFAMDQSGSINSTEYLQEAAFILGLAVDIDRVNAMVSYGLMAFATIAEVMAPFPSDLGALEAAFRQPRPLDGETNMQDGLQGCVDMLQSVSENRVILLVTDGRETIGSALPVADAAKAMGIGIATVGIGNKLDKQFLRVLATDPSYFTRTEFGDLLDDTTKVTIAICGAAENQIPTPTETAAA